MVTKGQLPKGVGKGRRKGQGQGGGEGQGLGQGQGQGGGEGQGLGQGQGQGQVQYWSLSSGREDQVLLVQQGFGEVVDGSDGAKCHGGILPPQQVGPKHHRQVRVGHLVHLALCRHLHTQKTQNELNVLIRRKYTNQLLGRGNCIIPEPGTG